MQKSTAGFTRKQAFSSHILLLIIIIIIIIIIITVLHTHGFV